MPNGYIKFDDNDPIEVVDATARSKMHEHSNKTVLDSITSEKMISWNNKSDFDGNYESLTGKPTLHSHDNKTVLDGISADKVNEWNGKSNFSGAYNDLSGKPDIASEVKSALCSDGAWTATEQQKAQAKLGLISSVGVGF